MEETIKPTEAPSDNHLHSVDPVHEPPVNHGHGILTRISYGTHRPRETGIAHLGAREGLETSPRSEENQAA